MPDNSIDVVISNCVINFSTDKPAPTSGNSDNQGADGSPKAGVPAARPARSDLQSQQCDQADKRPNLLLQSMIRAPSASTNPTNSREVPPYPPSDGSSPSGGTTKPLVNRSRTHPLASPDTHSAGRRLRSKKCYFELIRRGLKGAAAARIAVVPRRRRELVPDPTGDTSYGRPTTRRCCVGSDLSPTRFATTTH
ncbi:hypothetical protein [Nocardia sp. NPDC004860]|uniref:hypothetical protein n=1 Tax=Nocardia sp. NPDC004860 TaxID=3154557 RepID=UPI0033A6B5A0